ncbi:unnamed protein product [Rotaria sp. Silwood1]|nr:unnamed protein product [Rotaria sp. Silwood1]CAF1501952.1 unnamed protein product [Rotaria sp. Silwood1]
MINNTLFNRVYLLFILLNTQCLTLKLRSIQLNMYMTTSFDFCMRYLTRNSMTGCSSHKSGNRGRLIDISSLNQLLSYKYSYPIIVLVPSRKDILDFAIFHAPMIVGILIDGKIMNTTNNHHFTEVNNCPENLIDLSISTNCSIRKNKYGIDFRGISIDKPIFLLTNQTIVDDLRKISYLYNQQQISKGKYINVHMKSYAYGIKNAQICNRRSKSTYFGEAYFKHYSIKCRSPMINIVWSIFNAISIKNTRPPKSVIIFYTKFDFFSIFQPTNAGAQSTAFGVVTLFGLAWLLGRINLSQLLISNNNNKDIVFLFINGENWNYYGTLELSKIILEKRFPYKIDKSSNEDNLHPIESEHIDIMINIDQLGINHNHTYILYDNTHPFLEKFKEVSSTSITFEQISNRLNSLNDFRLLNISTLAILTNAYENMNPFYNSYQDTLIHIKDYSSIEYHIYILLKTICSYFNLLICVNELSIDIKQILNDRIQALFDCFLRSNCSNLILKTNETSIFYFKEILNNMKEKFSFLQPVLHQSDVKKYINNHFFDASSYIHDILLNWIAIRTTNISEILCNEIGDIFQYKIYQKSTETCLYGSVNSINLIRNIDELIDDRIIFTSNYDEPELLVYMIDETKKDIIMLICGIILFICGFILTYFLKNLLSVIVNNEDTF